MIFLSTKLDILSIRSRDALLSIQSRDHGLSPSEILLWFLETRELEKEIQLYAISPSRLKKNHPSIIKFQRIRYFFKNYFLLYRYVGSCKKALLEFQYLEINIWLKNYEQLAENQLDLHCGDIIDRQIFIRNSYNLSIDHSYLIPIIDFLELYESQINSLKNSF